MISIIVRDAAYGYEFMTAFAGDWSSDISEARQYPGVIERPSWGKGEFVISGADISHCAFNLAERATQDEFSRLCDAIEKGAVIQVHDQRDRRLVELLVEMAQGYISETSVKTLGTYAEGGYQAVVIGREGGFTVQVDKIGGSL